MPRGEKRPRQNCGASLSPCKANLMPLARACPCQGAQKAQGEDQRAAAQEAQRGLLAAAAAEQEAAAEAEAAKEHNEELASVRAYCLTPLTGSYEVFSCCGMLLARSVILLFKTGTISLTIKI
jgi:hypothetical protein